MSGSAVSGAWVAVFGATGAAVRPTGRAVAVAREPSRYGTHLRTRELCYQSCRLSFIPWIVLIYRAGRRRRGSPPSDEGSGPAAMAFTPHLHRNGRRRPSLFLSRVVVTM